MDREFQMLTKHYTYQPQVSFQHLIFEVGQDAELEKLFSQLSTEKSWGKRKAAAHKLGYTRSQEAVANLLRTLLSDPFWMVRYTIFQALEKFEARTPSLRSRLSPKMMTFRLSDLLPSRL